MTAKLWSVTYLLHVDISVNVVGVGCLVAVRVLIVVGNGHYAVILQLI